MTSELRIRNQAQNLWIRAMTSAYLSGVQLYDPSVWQSREPELEEKMLRDADICHAIDFRRHAIAGKRWDLQPRVEGSPRADMSVAVGTELLDGIKQFTSARFNLARAFFSGSRFAYVHGEPKRLKIGDGRERTWWVPVRLEDQDKRLYRVVPKNEDGELSGHWERWDFGRGDWEPVTVEQAKQTIRHVYQDEQATLGYGRALREALGWWWYAKTHVFQESIQAVERFAQGIIHARVRGVRDAATNKPNETLISEWQSALEDLRSRHVLVSDIEDQVEVISGSAEGWQLLHEIRGELRTTIFTLVLGANLTTAAEKGGSYALAEIQENSTESIVQCDRELLEETLTDDLLGCLWHKNYPNLVELGVANEKPRFSIVQEKRQDPQERAQVAQLLNQMGVDLSKEDVLDQCGFSKPKEGEDIIGGKTGAQDMPFGALPGMNNEIQ